MKCERRDTTKHRYESASGRREAGESGTWEYNDLVEFSEAEAAKQTKKSFPSFLSPCGGGSGGSRTKMNRIFGVCTREWERACPEAFVRTIRRSARTS